MTLHPATVMSLDQQRTVPTTRGHQWVVPCLRLMTLDNQPITADTRPVARDLRRARLNTLQRRPVDRQRLAPRPSRRSEA